MRFTPPRFTDETRPKNFDELVDALETQRVAGWWRGLGVIALLIAMPIVMLLAVSIGARDREHNCRTTEQALVGENAGITSKFAQAFIDPGDSPAEIAGVYAKADLARRGLNANVRKIMASCNG